MKQDVVLVAGVNVLKLRCLGTNIQIEDHNSAIEILTMAEEFKDYIQQDKLH